MANLQITASGRGSILSPLRGWFCARILVDTARDAMILFSPERIVGGSMKHIFFGTVVLCLQVTTSFAQINNATVTGTVADATGAVLPGVSITATNTNTGVMTTVLTNEAGAYTILSLLAGPARVTAHLPGFQEPHNSTVHLDS